MYDIWLYRPLHAASIDVSYTALSAPIADRHASKVSHGCSHTIAECRMLTLLLLRLRNRSGHFAV